uniref:BOS complex subunit NCLN n=1 Tax=Panagrolaimus superbus TaxID=310955 RepID=A0A914YAW3_9BILA
MQEDWIDVLRNFVIFAYIFALIPWSLASSATKAATDQGVIAAEVEFRAFRLRHYDFSGVQYGSTASKVAYDAVSLGSDVVRKALIVNWNDLVGKDIEKLLSAPTGAIIVGFLGVEKQLENFKTDQAVYIVPDSEEIQYVLGQLTQTTEKAVSVTRQLYNLIFSNNYVLSSSLSNNPAQITPKQFNVIATLNAKEKSPTLAFVAHYDSCGIAPGLVTSSDSNGSGVAALLELFTVFKKFYSDENSPKYNLLFAFTAGGKYNYQGSRHFIDSLSEKENIRLVTCLDSLGSGEDLYMQVSKIPNDDAIAKKVFDRISNNMPKNRNIKMAHKKINLGNEWLAWEHEIYNIRKKPAVTLTHFSDHDAPLRNSLLDTIETVNIDALYANTKAIANGVLSYIYDLDETLCADAFSEHVECSFATGDIVNKERITSFLDAIASRPRHVENSETFSNYIKEILERYEVKPSLQPVKFVDTIIYGNSEDTIFAHSTKAPIFEFFIGIFVALYLYLFYLFSVRAEKIFTLIVFPSKKGSYEDDLD